MNERTSAALFGFATVCAALALGLITGLTGSPVLALVAILAPIVGYAMVRSPVAWVAFVVVIGVQFLDDPSEHPGMGLYKTPLLTLGRIAFKSLDASLGLRGVKLFGVEAAIAALGVMLLAGMASHGVLDRIVYRGRRASPRHQLVAPPLLWAVAVGTVTVMFLFLHGLARGGPLSFALLQGRVLLTTLVMPVILSALWQDRRWVHRVLSAIVVVAFLRTAIGFYFYAKVIRHVLGAAGGSGDYVTTHSDSIIVAVAVVIVLVWVMSRPSIKRGIVAMMLTPYFGAFIVINNRRIAVVAVVLGILVIALSARGRLRRRLLKIAAVVFPLILLYIAAGWTANGKWAAPVQGLKSIVEQEDESSKSRDLENYNLVVTLKTAKLLGTGYGHEYIEEIKGPDLGDFTVYRYMPHNAVLGLMNYGGFVGFTLIWWFFTVCVFLAFRIMWMAKTEADRALGMISIGVIVSYLVMAWGDLGIQNWHNALLLMSILGLIGPAALRTGAWPRREQKLSGAANSGSVEA